MLHCSLQHNRSHTRKKITLGGRTHLFIPDGVPHVKSVVLQAILGLYSLLMSLILALVLLSLLDHPLNFIFAQAALVISDGDLVLGACTQQLGMSTCSSQCLELAYT